MRPFLALLFAFALVAASCGGSDTPDGQATPTTVDPDSLPEDTVLFDGDDESVPTEATSDGEPAPETTTTTAPPAPSASPSLAIYRFGTLGGWDGTRWFDGFADTAAGVPASAGDSYQLVGVGISPGTVAGSDPVLVCDPIGGYGIETSPELAHGGFDTPIAIGVTADWDVLPRTASITTGGSGVYLDEVARLISENGIDPSFATVDSVARVDLEGDGVDEVVVSASRAPNWPLTSVGDYSLVFLRKVVEEEVQTAILVGAYLPTERDDLYWVRGRLAGFADLNGDAKLEILVRTEYYEGDGVEAFEYVNDDLGPMRVISGGCGA